MTVSKEVPMPALRRLFLRLTYELGSGRALDNAARELEEVRRIYDAIDAMALRVAPAEPEMPRVA
jgi:hypothetical protein